MAKKYFSGHVSNKLVNEDIDTELIDSVNSLKKVVAQKMEILHISEAIEAIFETYRKCNKYIDETMPWALAKDENSNDRLQTVMYNLLESIRVCTNLLSPYLPDTSENIMSQLNINNNSFDFEKDNVYFVNDPEVLFKRIS